MATSQQNITKGPRRPNRKAHHGGQNSRSTVSDNDAGTSIAENSAGAGEGKSRPRRKSHAVKNKYAQSDAGAQSDGPTQRGVHQPARTQATPVKQQAYAGPTFHQSPAASALPIPSFYSKSLPAASFVKPPVEAPESPAKSPLKLDDTNDPILEKPVQRETTPLDFLFDAARKASHTPGTESPNHKPYYLSSAANTPVSRSPAIREGDTDFPFELDTGDQAPGENGSAFSTPYKERIEAVRSISSTSAGSRNLNEDERQAKTAALKSFLMNSVQAQAGNIDNNPFNARPAPISPDRGRQRPFQHRSNPTTPYNHNGQSNSQQYFPPMPPVPNLNHYQSPSRVGATSSLRNVYKPAPDRTDDGNFASGIAEEQPRISTARDQAPGRSNFGDIYDTSSQPKQQVSTHRATPSAQQLEDDIRKFLKLDLVSRG